jgi:glycosyltransferase involved in cell wall biosynthesis
MKILQLSHVFLPNIGGIEFYVYRLTRDLRDHTTLIITSMRKTPRSDLDGISAKYLTSRTIVPRNPMLFGLEKELRAFGPDIVHLHSIWFIPSFQAILLKKRYGFKVVNTVHGAYPDEATFAVKVFTTLFKPMAKYILKNSDHIIALTPKEKQKMVDIFGVPEGKISVIGNGVDEIDVDESVKDNVLRKTGNNFILFTGRIIPDKNPEVLVEAFDIIADRYPAYKVVFVGPIDETYKDRLTRLSKNPDRLVFYGSLHPVFQAKELAALYGLADVSVAIGSWEGLPTRVLESMIQKTPAVVYSSGGSSDLIEDEENGYLISELSAKSVSEKLHRYLGETEATRETIGTNAREAIEDYRWSNKVADVTKVYSSL